jgi:hypothetical protein
MTTETLKSTAITNLDAVPPVRATAGLGGVGMLKSVYGNVAPTTGYLTGSNYKMVRVPSDCSVKHVLIDYSGTITTMTCDVTIFYSDDTLDETGASSGDTGVVNSLSTTGSLFAHTLVLASQTAGAVVDITDQNVAYPPTARNEPLWQAAGLTTDPGGFFDVVIMNVSTMSLSAAKIGLEVQYVEAYS